MLYLNYMDRLPDEIINYIHILNHINVIICAWRSYSIKKRISIMLLTKINSRQERYVTIPYTYNLLQYSFKFIHQNEKNILYKRILLKTVNSLVENEDVNGIYSIYYDKIDNLFNTLLELNIIKCN